MNASEYYVYKDDHADALLARLVAAHRARLATQHAFTQAEKAGADSELRHTLDMLACEAEGELYAALAAYTNRFGE